MDNFAREGLRTLLFAQKKISKEDYAVWNMLHKNASLSINNWESMLEEVAAKIEFDLEIVGSSAIEDRL